MYTSAYDAPIGEAAVALRTICAAILVVMLSTAAHARQPDAFDSCAQTNDPAARLACFDREVAARNAVDPAFAPSADRPPPASSTSTAAARTTTAATANAAAVTRPAAGAASAPVAAPAAARPAPPSISTTAAASAPADESSASSSSRDIGLDPLELRRQRAQRGESEPAGPTAIEAVLIKVIQRQPLISAFELDNGQIWEQSEAMKVVAAPHQKVKISHGVLGAFFLKTADGRVVVRVHRLR